MQSSDQTVQFFRSLKHYKPLCHRGGAPLLLSNQGWTQPFTCIVIINLIFALSFVGLKLSAKPEAKTFLLINIALVIYFDFMYFCTQFVNPGIVYKRPYEPEDVGVMQRSERLSMQNPQLLPTTIPPVEATNPAAVEPPLSDLQKQSILRSSHRNSSNFAQFAPQNQKKDPYASLRVCATCKVQKDQDTTHCDQCNVCVYGIDHHCAWFGRCIAGINKWFFYGFILGVFMMFLQLLASLTLL